LRGRVVVGVFGDALPMTVFNFINLVHGYKHGSVVASVRAHKP
jgi:cyclophilin family peptidyl-prolyl cis-trans isomerase